MEILPSLHLISKRTLREKERMKEESMECGRKRWREKEGRTKAEM